MPRAQLFAPALAALTLLVAPADPGHAQGIVLEQCADDVAFYCTDVEPGDGRMISCLYAHTATLDDACHAAMDDYGRLLEAVFDTVNAVHRGCGPALAEHCADLQPGEGGHGACLGQVAALPEACAAPLAKLRALGEE